MDSTCSFKMLGLLDHSEVGLSFIMCSMQKKTQTSGIYNQVIMLYLLYKKNLKFLFFSFSML